jgi:hypothetical protein
MRSSLIDLSIVPENAIDFTKYGVSTAYPQTVFFQTSIDNSLWSSVLPLLAFGRFQTLLTVILVNAGLARP